MISLSLTSGKSITEDLGVKLENVKLEDLGQAQKVVIDKDNTTILIDKSKGNKKEIDARCETIRKQIKETTSDYDREKLQERLAKLAGGVAVINVGAATEVEMKEKKAPCRGCLARQPARPWKKGSCRAGGVGPHPAVPWKAM